jgi:hypothetical protein
MALTKITKIKWLTVADWAGNEALDSDREIKIQEMTAANKTDGIGIMVDDVTCDRYWIDQSAAQEYIDFITQKATQYNCNIVSTQILDAP